MVPPNAKYQVQMPPVVACPHCRANIQLPPGAPIVACPVCHTCIQMAFAPPPPVMQTGPSLQPGPSFAHTPVTPTPVATWQQPGQHQPPAPQDAYRVSIDPPGGDSTIREVSIFNARPRSLLNFRRDRTVVVHRSSEGSTGEMVKVCELLPGKYHHVEGQKAGTKWDARDASTGKVLLEWIIAEWTPIGPAADPRPAPVVHHHCRLVGIGPPPKIFSLFSLPKRRVSALPLRFNLKKLRVP
jgi:LSD1 subclass zinc finger protein